jgi:hypothetical protein
VILGADVDRTEIKEIRIGVVAVDFEDFGDESLARSSFNMNYDIE